jgi:hypothetical protein
MEILYTQKDYQEQSELANSQGLKLYRYQHDVEYTEVVGDWNYETKTITYTDIDGNEVTEEIQVKTTPIMTTGTIVTIDENGNEVEIIGQVQQTHEETKTKQVEELIIADFDYYICTFDNITDGTLNENYEEEKLTAEQEKIGNLTITKRDFMLAIQEKGITYEQVKNLVGLNPQAQMEWDLCVVLQRKNPLLDAVAMQVGITPEQLDEIFVTLGR